MKLKRRFFFIMCFVLAAVCSSAQAPKPIVTAPPTPASPASKEDTSQHQLTGPDVEAFLDGVMPQQLAREDIAGAVITIVKDGKVIFAKGYGFSDVEKRNPVTADATLFRPGSISKLFIWTSVMQLAEQGKLDLAKDVNEYLDFKIPSAFGKPITLNNIMTHTAGFEEIARDLFVADAQHMHTLEQFLKHHIPARIYPPGVVPAYSNYATALAGYIVQRVSGKPFEQYVQDNIYTPLDMHRTTFVQPLPADLQPMMSNGYQKASLKAKPFEFVEASPAGSVSTSGLDMTHFMIAHLQNGKYGEKQILKPETAVLMHSKLFAADDRMNAMAHGFYEESQNGHRIIGHGGDTLYFHSDLHLMLADNIGFFVSYNSAGKGETSSRTNLFSAFLDRYFPFTPPAAPKLDSAKQDGQQVAGFYKSSRRFDTSFLSATTVLGEPHVIANDDGTISIDDSKKPSGEVKKFEEISPLLYREVNAQDRVAFKKDAAENLQFEMDYPFFIFQKVGLLENKYFNLGLLIYGLVVCGLAVLLWPVAAIARKHYQKPLVYAAAEFRSRMIIRSVCILLLIFFVAWFSVLSLTDDASGINSLPPWIIGLSLLGVLATIGTLVVCYLAFRSITTPGRWAWTKIQDFLIALACLSLVFFAMNWHLMNFNVHY